MIMTTALLSKPTLTTAQAKLKKTKKTTGLHTFKEAPKKVKKKPRKLKWRLAMKIA